MMDNQISGDDAFAELSRMRGGGKAKTDTPPPANAKPQASATPQTPSASPTITEPPTKTAAPVAVSTQTDEEETGAENGSGGRNVLVGVYVDNAMDDFLEHYASQRIAGTRKKPSRSLVSYWLMQLGMQALEAEGRPPMPREFAKRRR